MTSRDELETLWTLLVLGTTKGEHVAHGLCLDAIQSVTALRAQQRIPETLASDLLAVLGRETVSPKTRVSLAARKIREVLDVQ